MVIFSTPFYMILVINCKIFIFIIKELFSRTSILSSQPQRPFFLYNSVSLSELVNQMAAILTSNAPKMSF